MLKKNLNHSLLTIYIYRRKTQKKMLFLNKMKKLNIFSFFVFFKLKTPLKNKKLQLKIAAFCKYKI